MAASVITFKAAVEYLLHRKQWRKQEDNTLVLMEALLNLSKIYYILLTKIYLPLPHGQIGHVTCLTNGLLKHVLVCQHE